MADIKNEEVDIFYVFDKLKEFFKKLNVLIFRGINFIKSKWIIIFALIIAGAAFGYYESNTTEKEKKATVLLRINFDSANYVYTSIELLNEKVSQQDNSFLSNIGFKNDIPEIKSMEITPIINLKEIIEKYEVNDRNFEAVIKNIDFTTEDEEIQLSDLFNSEYKYHKLEIELTNDGNKETLSKIIDFLNNNELLQQFKEVTNRDILEHVENNKETISQINKVLDTYTSNESLQSPSSQIYVVDKNFSINNIIEKKIELQQETESLNQFLVYSKEIVVMVNQPNITKLKKGFSDNKTIFYPLVLVFTFLFLAFIRFSYISFRNKALLAEAEYNK
jgi:hypothetical protein